VCTVRYSGKVRMIECIALAENRQCFHLTKVFMIALSSHLLRDRETECHSHVLSRACWIKESLDIAYLENFADAVSDHSCLGFSA
jgi:hypothetical protein